MAVTTVFSQQVFSQPGYLAPGADLAVRDYREQYLDLMYRVAFHCGYTKEGAREFALQKWQEDGIEC